MSALKEVIHYARRRMPVEECHAGDLIERAARELKQVRDALDRRVSGPRR